MPQTADAPGCGSRERLLAPPELADYLGIPEQTLANWRSANKGPKWYKVGRHARYRMSEVTAWLDADAARSGMLGTESLATSEPERFP